MKKKTAMAQDHRIAKPNGERASYSCENRCYATNIKKGFSHYPISDTRGSFFKMSLIESDGHSLWLEYVIEKETGEEAFWLMWYNPKGKPTIPLSGVFSKNNLESMAEKIAGLAP